LSPGEAFHEVASKAGMANTVRITAANWYTKWKKPHKQEVEGAFPLIFEFYERRCLYGLSKSRHP
jgi:hypothetical protein